MLALAYAMSSDRSKVDLRVVLWGVGLQWAFAALLLWVPAGKVALEAVANFVTGVLEHSYAGSEFLFGPLGMKGGGASGSGATRQERRRQGAQASVDDQVAWAAPRVPVSAGSVAP